MAKAKRYDTVVLLEQIGAVRKGAKGAVVEVYATPHEAYDIEIVTDEGETQGIAEAVRPEQIQVVATAPGSVRLTSGDVPASPEGARQPSPGQRPGSGSQRQHQP